MDGPRTEKRKIRKDPADQRARPLPRPSREMLQEIPCEKSPRKSQSHPARLGGDDGTKRLEPPPRCYESSHLSEIVHPIPARNRNEFRVKLEGLEGFAGALSYFDARGTVNKTVHPTHPTSRSTIKVRDDEIRELNRARNSFSISCIQSRSSFWTSWRRWAWRSW